jgi:membrane-bound serine protease (ClpP class)
MSNSERIAIDDRSPARVTREGHAAVVRRLAWVLALVPALASAGAPSSSSPPATSSAEAAPAGSSASTLAPTGRVMVVEIAGEIDLGLAPYVERVLKDARPEDLVLLHVNTFGGRIDAAVQIRDALLAAKAKTAAFVDSRANSAGALN